MVSTLSVDRMVISLPQFAAEMSQEPESSRFQFPMISLHAPARLSDLGSGKARNTSILWGRFRSVVTFGSIVRAKAHEEVAAEVGNWRRTVIPTGTLLD